MTTTTPPILIDVYADIACPWCYIGERRLARVLAERPELRAERRWRPFQLQPGLPAAGLPWAAFVEQKFGGADRAAQAFAQVVAAGESEGLRFDFARMPKAPNTRAAHRLIRYADAHDRLWETVEAVFAAYFSDGRDVTDLDELAAIAGAVGLDPGAARLFLAGDEWGAEVDADQREAGEIGVESVPMFVFNERYALTGAQPLAVFHEVFDVVVEQYAVPAD